MNLFTLRDIDADMNRKVLPFVQLPALYEQFFQFILQSGFFRLDGEVIGADSTAMLISKRVCQNLRKCSQQLVALKEAVLRVKELHSAEIHIHQYGCAAIFTNPVPACFRQIEEIGHAWEAGQIVILAGFHHAVFVKRVAEGFSQFYSLLGLSFSVDALIRIPNMCKTNSIVGKYVLPISMDDAIIGTIFDL